MNKTLLAIAIITLLSLLFFSSNENLTSFNKTPTEQACLEKIIPGFCEDNIYYYDECINNSYYANSFKCPNETECDANALTNSIESVCIKEEVTPTSQPQKNQTNTTTKSENQTIPHTCGNNKCDFLPGNAENCNTCPQDCACAENEECTNNGACIAIICGDTTCSENEDCCIDCGCENDLICNSEQNNCIEFPEEFALDEELIDLAVNHTGLNIEEITIEIQKTFYLNTPVKKVSIDCSKTVEHGEACYQELIFGANGELLLKSVNT